LPGRREADEPVMSVELEAPDLRNESELVFEWRLTELMRAGFPEQLALELALTTHVDLHAAVELRSRGCPPDTAARILI
jgi:hypothetical protein